MKIITDKTVRGSVKWVIPFCLFALLPLFASCSEDDDTVEEYPDWQARNESYFDALYATAKQQQDAGSSTWKVFRSYALNAELAAKAENHIVVEVLETGEGSGTPLFTDSVRVHYRGRLLPSTSYSDGYVFDQSYYGDFNWKTAVPSKFAVRALVDGFATALQQMHIGDRWRVYIPYALGYGTTDSNDIPAYSTLIFDMALVEYYRAGTAVPDYK